MANKTILQHVNSILSEMDSRQVASIGDTDESSEVQDIMESVFYEMQAVRPYRSTRRYQPAFNFGGEQTDTSRVYYNIMQEGSVYSGDIVRLDQVIVPKYKSELPVTPVGTKELTYLFPQDFIALLSNNSPESDSVDTINLFMLPSPQLNVLNNKQPEYYTSFDDKTIIFDSYDKDILPDGIPVTAIQLRVEVEVGFPTDETDFIEAFPRDVLQLLILKTKQRCFIALKNMDNSPINREVRRLERHQSRSQKVVGDEFPMASYGRRGTKQSSNWKFNKND